MARWHAALRQTASGFSLGGKWTFWNIAAGHVLKWVYLLFVQVPSIGRWNVLIRRHCDWLLDMHERALQRLSRSSERSRHVGNQIAHNGVQDWARKRCWVFKVRGSCLKLLLCLGRPIELACNADVQHVGTRLVINLNGEANEAVCCVSWDPGWVRDSRFNIHLVGQAEVVQESV